MIKIILLTGPTKHMRSRPGRVHRYILSRVRFQSQRPLSALARCGRIDAR